MEEPDREVTRALYEFYLEESRAAQRSQFDLGKWLLASLILVNGGAIVLLVNTKDPSLIAAAAPPFVVGIVAALACGLVTWLNAGVREMHYDSYVQPNSLQSGQIVIPKGAVKQEKRIWWTYWVSLLAGVASGAAFVWGAIVALA